jgi:plasmid stability protein
MILIAAGDVRPISSNQCLTACRERGEDDRMSTTLDLPEDILTAVAARAAQTGQPVEDAVVQLLRQALATDAGQFPRQDEAACLAHRLEMTQKFLTGEWGVELAGYEEGREADRRKEHERLQAWRK